MPAFIFHLPQGINLWIDETTFGWFGYGFFIDNLDIVATVIAALLVGSLVIFSQYTKQGRAMRAVADDHQAALSVGISLNFIWVLVWSLAGFVALSSQRFSDGGQFSGRR